MSPLPGELARNYGPCDYDIRHNLTAQYVYQLPIKFGIALALRAERLAGFGDHVLAQWDSVLRFEHALFGQWKRHREGQRTAIRQRRSRRPAL